ncbi:unnamed protein product, partial [Oncorhynchus mykiss]
AALHCLLLFHPLTYRLSVSTGTYHTHTLTRCLSVSTGTYLTHEAKGCDDAPDADTAIINAEGGHSGAEDKKEYFI